MFSERSCKEYLKASVFVLIFTLILKGYKAVIKLLSVFLV